MPRPPKPGGAVFVPRSFAPNRKKFGNSSERLTSEEVESPQQGAAELQHAITNRIREYVLDHGDLKEYCAKTNLPAGLTLERFQRINRGEAMITLTDVMYWANVIPNLAEFIGAAIDAIAKGEATPGHDAADSASARG